MSDTIEVKRSVLAGAAVAVVAVMAIGGFLLSQEDTTRECFTIETSYDTADAGSVTEQEALAAFVSRNSDLVSGNTADYDLVSDSTGTYFTGPDETTVPLFTSNGLWYVEGATGGGCD